MLDAIDELEPDRCRVPKSEIFEGAGGDMDDGGGGMSTNVGGCCLRIGGGGGPVSKLRTSGDRFATSDWRSGEGFDFSSASGLNWMQ